MPIEVFAKKVGINKKEQDWIVKNDKESHYFNNTPLKNSWLALGYPVYDGDYYFAFIHKNPRVNAQYNAKANRELRKYIKSSLSADQIYDEMENYFRMHCKNAGAGDTMTREELWNAIVDARNKNPVREGLGEGKGSDLFKKYSSVINRLSDKEKDEVIELLYTMNTQSGKRYKEALGKVKELLNMEYIPEDNILNTYRQMWEDGQKYAPKLELPEQELKEKLSATDLKLIDMMYDKKGKLTDVGKAVMNYKPGDNIRKIVQNLNNKK